jgi:tol-pal system protein YbgF
MKNIISPAIVALALTLSTATSVAAQSRVELQMAAELRMLQEQTQQLALTLAQLGEALKALNARIDASDDSTRQRFATQETLVKDIATNLSAVREGTQDTNTRLGQLRDEVEAMRSSLTSLPALLTSQLAPPTGAPADPTAPASTAGGAPPTTAGAPAAAPLPPPPAASTLGLSPTRMFNTALADYHAGQFTLAVTGFEQYLRQFPTTELADDAHFYMGEAYFAERKFEQAITAYNDAIQKFPNGDQAVPAYYKRGLAQDNLGQTDAARASWEQVIKMQPDSPQATLAKQNLDRIARRQTPAPARQP